MPADACDALIYTGFGLKGRNVILVVLNFTAEPSSMHIEPGEILVSTELDRRGENVSGALELRGNEGLIVQLR